MGPKTERRRTIQEETVDSLSDPINTDVWKCAVVLIAEGADRDASLIRMFVEEASTKVRREVKSIDFESDVMKILKSFIAGEIDRRYNFLLNFSSIFEEAEEYVKNMESIPTSLMVKIIKTLILMLRKENELETKERLLCRDNCIDVMAAKPFVPFYGFRESENDDDDDKKKSGRKKSVKNGVTGVTGVKIKPPTPAKTDTKLLRRGEQAKDFKIIDDVPKNTYFQLYIALTGFHDPDLALEMLKFDIPLYSVVCLKSPSALQPNALSITMNQDAFWKEFLQLLWRRDLTHHFKDVVFLLYSPAELPSNEKELRAFIFTEISFLMYDLSDLTHQLALYLRHMRLWNVDETPEKIVFDTSELDLLPYECMSIPLIMQGILDSLCGEDEESDEADHSESYETGVVTRESTILTVSRTGSTVPYESRTSFTSLAPLTSSVRLPTPHWSTIIDTEEKLFLFNKTLLLDKLYNLDDNADISHMEMSTSNVNACLVKKKRLSCENLDMEIESHSEGLVVKLWKNYPVRATDEATALSHHTAKLKYPELAINYVLYIIWIMKMEDSSTENYELVSISDSLSNISETRFTVTDCSRIALHKMNRSPSFFSPSELKIISPRMLKTASEPQLSPQSLPKFFWTEKSFVSDVHIPVKYLEGAPMNVFDDLRNYLGEEAFSRMKDYDFIEELNKNDLKERIQEAASNYDCIHHAYLPLTDCIYIVLYDHPTESGLQRQIYNVMLTTPIGLRDFYDYVLDDEKEWLSEQILREENSKVLERCPDHLYNPTPDFREFTEHDFWHENSIKYMTYEGEIVESVKQRMSSGDSAAARRRTREEKRMSMEKSQSSIYAKPGEPYKFVGFDLEPGAVQYSGVDMTFQGPDSCKVRASLQERLYGTQQLGVHIQQGGHNLHLYSYVCPQPHLDKPYTCHVEYKNGTILAFARRMFLNQDITPEGSSTASQEMLEDEKFAYDMKMSFPHGLTVTTVPERTYPCYIKQFYRKNNSNVALNEKKRLFLPNGSIIKMLTNDTVEVLTWNTSLTTAPLDDLVLPPSQSVSQFSDIYPESNDSVGERPYFRSFTKTSADGCKYTVLNGEVTEILQYQILTRTEMEIQRTYYRRMDGVSYIMMDDGSICVEFLDGSKICSYLQEEELYVEEDTWDGEDTGENVYLIVHMKIVMEHPDYATAIYDTGNSTWRVILPCDSEIEVDHQGCYQVHLDRRTQLDISTKAIRMWRYSPQDDVIINTTTDLTVFDSDPSGKYCTTTDCRGRKFTVESNGSCYVTENNWNEHGSTSTFENQSEDFTEPKRYFVVRRDLSGFEIIHTKNVKKEVEIEEPDVIIHCQKLKNTPVTRYFALLKEMHTDSNKWKVGTIVPDTKCCVAPPTTSSTYGKPPSWLHAFPKRKLKVPKPGVLHGRIILETTPTSCPDPKVSNTFTFYDTSDFPEPGPSISDDVTTIMRRVANQDQVLLKEIYYTAVRERSQAAKIQPWPSREIEKYLKMSKYHVQRRECLKKCIYQKKIPPYFDYPPGIAWQIIETIIKSCITQAKERNLEPSSAEGEVASPKESSGVEYNLEWSTEPSYSDLSYRSNLSTKTAPEMSRFSMLQALLPPSRKTVSEPIYKMESLSSLDDDLSRGSAYSYTPKPDDVCVFTKEDMLVLEKTISSSSGEAELEKGTFELEDLMNLGLV